ncbi:MAG TPA: hypothetical protein VMZ90_01875, partial [Vicinamibacterales bacterium]|nr:hypothetical protein [Vicinamibacterales bacterium]
HAFRQMALSGLNMVLHRLMRGADQQYLGVSRGGVNRVWEGFADAFVHGRLVYADCVSASRGTLFCNTRSHDWQR